MSEKKTRTPGAKTLRNRAIARVADAEEALSNNDARLKRETVRHAKQAEKFGAELGAARAALAAMGYSVTATNATQPERTSDGA